MAHGKWQMAQAPTKEPTKEPIKDATKVAEDGVHIIIQPAEVRFRAECWRRALAQVRSQWLFSTSPMKRSLPVGVIPFSRLGDRRGGRRLVGRAQPAIQEAEDAFVVSL